jgi:hypothetical protein
MFSGFMSGLSDDICNDAKGASLNVFLNEAADADASALQGSSRTKPFEGCDDEHQREVVERAMFLSSLRG